MTDLILAAPPPAEPPKDYVELIGIPLLIAIVTALVTAIVTAHLSTRRSRNDRLATLRLEMYRDLVVYSKRWAGGLRSALAKDIEGEDSSDQVEAWRADADVFMDQMNLLPVIVAERTHKRIWASFEEVVQTAFGIDEDSPDEARADGMKATINKLEALTAVVIAEGRKDVRRLGA